MKSEEGARAPRLSGRSAPPTKKRYPFGKWTGIAVLAAFAIGFISYWQEPACGAAGEIKYLADRHQAKGIACASCHKESPPKAAVPAAVCLGCHGSYAKIAERTMNASPNPHASHMSALPCENCHHAHKAPENQCNTCHEFNMKVP
jgi:hypothetical protein